MSIAARRSQQVTAEPASQDEERAPALRAADVLLPVSVLLWGVGVARTDVSHLGPYGLIGAVPLIFYAGLALLLISAGIELTQRRLSRVRMALHAAVFVVILYGTAPIVYTEGRYSWLYKTIGVVQYVNANGHLNKNIDIYQNWPGFFAFTAWFDKVAGVASPLVYAKWWQLLIELAALPLLYLAYTALALPARHRWIGLFLYSAGNWIGQDYFSPQSLGTLLSIGVLVIVLRWMFAGNSSWQSRRFRRGAMPSGSGLRGKVPVLVLLFFVFFVLTFTHELSPYTVLFQIAALALARLVQPRWVPVALAVIAVGYFIPRWGFVNSHFGLLNSVGQFFSNAAPPSSTPTWPVTPVTETTILRASRVLSLGIWSLALLGAWVRRKSRRTVLALLLLTFSPVAVLAAGAYGNEGILRVYLFSLPWAAALGAAALAPVPALAMRSLSGYQGSAWNSRTAGRFGAGRFGQAIRLPIAVGVALLLFFPAFFGDDRANLSTPAEVTMLTDFQNTAPAGTVYMPSDGAPLADTARYNQFNWVTIFGAGSLIVNKLPPANIASLIAQDAQLTTPESEPAYVVVSPSMLAYNAAHPVMSDQGFQILLDSLAKSPQWVLLAKSDGTTIYELPPGSSA